MTYNSIRLVLITCFSVFLTACVSPSQPMASQETTQSQPKVVTPSWVPLMEGMKVTYDANYEYHPREMKLSNGKLIRGKKWEEYIKPLISQYSLPQRDIIIEGLSRFYTEYDKVDDIIRFEPERYSRGPYSRASYLSLTGSIKEKKVRKTAKFYYYSSSWLFVKKVKIVGDDFSPVEFSVNAKRNNYGGNIWEYFYLDLSIPEARNLINDIISSTNVTVRFYGRQYYDDLEISDRMQNDMMYMLKALDTIEEFSS